jgi:hypothetical protein
VFGKRVLITAFLKVYIELFKNQTQNTTGAFQIYAFLLPHPALSEGEGNRW